MGALSFYDALRVFHKLSDSGDGGLYVHRPLNNAGKLHEWAKAAGVKNVVPPSEMHVTQVYSRNSVPIEPRTNILTVSGDKRKISPLGDKGALVMHIHSQALDDRHKEVMAAGGSHDWPKYMQHITLSYDAGDTPSNIEPPTFPLEFGPEVHAPINDDWAEEKGLRKMVAEQWKALSFVGALAVLRKDFNPDQPRDQDGKWTGGGIADPASSDPKERARAYRQNAGPVETQASDEDVEWERQTAALQGTTYHEEHGPLAGAAFVSPSVTDKDFGQASAALSSDRQKVFETASHDIDNQLGLHGEQSSVIGAWADGAENSTMIEAHNPGDVDAVRTATVMKGALANQKQVLVFATADDGPHRLYAMEVPGEPAAAHADLLKSGIPFHTLSPNSNGTATRVIVVDTDGSLRKNVGDFAEAHGTAALAWPGNAEFIGDTRPDDQKGDDAEQRNYAQGVYQRAIAAAPSGNSGRSAGEIWQGVRDRWSARLQAAKRALGFLDALAHMRKAVDYF